VQIGDGRRIGRADTRERILAAAASVAHDVGLGHLSLDAVAERAGVSKGGLLYHFPTKQALLVAVVENQIALTEQAIESASNRLGTSGAVQALAYAFREMVRHKPQPAAGVIAAMAANPALLEPVRAHNRRVVERLKISEDSESALIVFYAIEGMRALHLFQTDPLGPEERERVLEAITALVPAKAEETSVPAAARPDPTPEAAPTPRRVGK
jgi:AcrR family transcriptional regulator